MSVKAIETIYNGYRFRSRLEARWAVLFDALGIRYQYEPEGYEVPFIKGAPLRYLPDFYLPDYGIFAEVKGVDTFLEFPEDDLTRMSWFVDYHGPCEKGILLLGNIPDPGHGIRAYAMKWCKGVGIYQVDITGNGIDIAKTPITSITAPVYLDDLQWLMDMRLCSSMNETGFMLAMIRARSARFEHGETPRKDPIYETH